MAREGNMNDMHRNEISRNPYIFILRCNEYIKCLSNCSSEMFPPLFICCYQQWMLLRLATLLLNIEC